MPLRL